MRYSLVLIAALATPLMAQDYNYRLDYVGPLYPAYPSRGHDFPVHPRPGQHAISIPNVHGGYNYYIDSRPIGTTMPNVHGGYNLYPTW